MKRELSLFYRKCSMQVLSGSDTDGTWDRLYGTAPIYLLGSFVGFLKAIFWSGGWCFYISLFFFGAAFIPRPHREDLVNALDNFSIPHPQEWQGFLIIGLSLAALGYALRVAYLETSRATLRLYPVWQIDRIFFYFGVENISFKELSTCLVKIVSFKDSSNAVLPFAVPVALQTEQQDLKGKTGRFNLSPGEPKTLKFISCEKDPQLTSLIRIHTENNDEIEVPGHKLYTIEVGLYGAGAPVVRKYRVSIAHEELVCVRSFREFRFAKWKLELLRA
jgi:hypothetical protein